MASRIHVGTSGYRFEDWIGTVYPAGIQSRDLLSYYACLFDSVEINSTYYQVPSARMFEGMLKKVPKGFTFVVKLPKEVTHERTKLESVVAPFLDGIAPLEEAAQLGGLLAQFPYSFRAEQPSLDHLERVAEAFLTVDRPVSVEFRHAGWCEERTYKLLADLNLGFVNVDLPRLENLPGPTNVRTTPVAYYRLHGRNRENWWERTAGGDRYDYLYSELELEDWAVRVEEASRTAISCYVFANNCHLGQSVVNALQLRRRLRLPSPSAPPGRTETLFEPSVDELIASMGSRVKNSRRAQAV